MAITLPLDNQTWPMFRVLTRASWGSAAGTPRTSAADWTVETMVGAAGSPIGFDVLEFDRVCLPQIGRARLVYRYGKINGTDYTPPSRTGYEVRIQAAPYTTGSPAWRTVWWGTVETQDDGGDPAANIRQGDRIYHCVDGLYRMSRWYLDRHGFAGNDGAGDVFYGALRGHPGYNVAKKRDGRLAGNRWNDDTDLWTTDSGGTAQYHTRPGTATAVTWTDQLAIEHAQAVCRRPGEPTFALVSSTGSWSLTPQTIDRLQGASSWEVREGETVLDFIGRVLKRERGKGLAFLDWNDDSGAPTGALTVFLRVWPQHAADVVYDDPVTGSTITIPGSYSGGTNAGNVDLRGDHRVVDSAFHLGDRDAYKLDALESIGEFIEVLVTLSYTDSPSGSSPNIEGYSLKRRWTSTEQATFRARTAAQRIDERFRPVYQLHGLPLAWDFKAANGNNGTLYRCDYRCNGEDTGYAPVSGPSNGAIIAEGAFTSVSVEGTSPLLVEILDDLPLYDGYDYRDATIERWDAQTERNDTVRRPLLTLLRISSNRYVKLGEVLPNLEVKVDGQDIWVYDHQADGSGARLISDPTAASSVQLGALFNYTALCFTVALRLPHRVRLYSGLAPDNANCRRKATVYHPDHHLWLAHPGAIWDLDATTGSKAAGHDPRRAAAGAAPDNSAPGLLRDDRSALARLHYMTWSWYGTARRTATWALRAFPFSEGFQAYAGTTISGSPSSYLYPRLGQTMDQLGANGEDHVLNTPVTRIAYDNASGVTTWSTDWNDLEYEK